MSFHDTAASRFELLYGSEVSEELTGRLEQLVTDYGFRIAPEPQERPPWSEQDVIVITYGDFIYRRNDDTPTLRVLEQFYDEYLSDQISTIHILPFFPFSSDSGFSVIDYKTVREDLGDWSDIEHLGKKYRLMADLVINHTSRFSEWFENYEKGERPGLDYFIEMDPSRDLSEVTRPRNTPLLTAVQTNRGLRYVWTTFSDDQIDLNFRNPEVLFEFLDIFLFYLSKDIKIIRLDAIAYLWKKAGTTSIHLEQTHEVVKLFRDIVKYAAPDATLITETNVPFEENISYFGEGDEAQMIYQFSLPPLLLHAILTENASYLTAWAKELSNPPEGCMYFNFTASHDGIGVRPLEGLVPDEEFEYLVEGTKKRGGFVSYKKNANNTKSPYELNITYFDAFEKPGQPRSELQIRRYQCSQLIMLSLKGVPGIYFHNFTGTKNNMDGVIETGKKREINRMKWELAELERCLADEDDIAHRIFHWYREVLDIRKTIPAFAPRADQEVFSVEDDLFVFTRHSESSGDRVGVICNLTSAKKQIPWSRIPFLEDREEGYTDLLKGETFQWNRELRLDPFQVVWLRL